MKTTESVIKLKKKNKYKLKKTTILVWKYPNSCEFRFNLGVDGLPVAAT